MTPEQLRQYRWDSTTKPAPFEGALFPRSDVFGEIKPHNRSGIVNGIHQLRGYRKGRSRATPQLITYRQSKLDPTKFEVLAADSKKLKEVLVELGPPDSGKRLTDAQLQKLRWYQLGQPMSVPEATERLLFWQCPGPFGAMIEKRILRKYVRMVKPDRKVELLKKSPYHRGADFSHEQELVAFLRELAAELEAEAASPWELGSGRGY